MRHQFSAGVERAITQAAKWSGCEGSNELEAPALLLGLLAELECRAAITLAEHGIDAEAVLRRWPGLTCPGDATPSPDKHTPTRQVTEPPIRVPQFSADVEQSLAIVATRLSDHPEPLILGTEHVLLGLAAGEHELADWLRSQAVEPDRLEAEINRRYGHRPGPLAADDEQMPGIGSSPDVELPCPHPSESGNPPDAEPIPPAPGGPSRRPSLDTKVDGSTRVLRVLDAAANRGREGLRVVEDYVRFVLDDQHLTGLLKRFRHELTALLARIPADSRMAARETQADVGTKLATPGERTRQDTAGVLGANFARVQESLRTIEEFSKLLDPDLACRFEQLRYRSYTLQRAVEITRRSLERLGEARLYVLIDGGSSLEQLAGRAEKLADAGVDVIQLRDKRLGDRQLLERARLLRETTRSSGVTFIVNDRPDLAVLSRADGVHVGQEELTVKDARAIVGAGALIGVSTHSIDQARQAVLDGANYIGVGPTFPSGTKKFQDFPGLDLLRAVAAEVRLPAFAIGGITCGNLPQVLEAGFRRVAVSGAVTTADPAAAVRQLLTGMSHQS